LNSKSQIASISSATPETTCAGALDVPHLEVLWNRTRLARGGKAPPDSAPERMRDQVVFAGLGLGLEETIQYLFKVGPAFPEFEQWILNLNGGAIAPERIERINAALRGDAPPAAQQKIIAAIESAPPVLDAADLAFWEQHGYVIVRGAISPGDSRACAQLLWNHLKIDPNLPDTWQVPNEGRGIMVQLFHHPLLQRNRESPRIRKAFAQLWGTADLWATTDRMSFNPPERPDRPFQGPRLHWDTSLAQPIPFGLQGLLYLTDTSANQGAFTCVPGFHRKIEGWLKNLPAGANPRQQDLESLGPKPIAAGAGDLIIWHHALPHGSSPNRATQPRMVHYLTLFPAVAEPEREWL
jgi:hypothetical protein